MGKSVRISVIGAGSGVFSLGLVKDQDEVARHGGCDKGVKINQVEGWPACHRS